MDSEKFKLPLSSYSELAKIIRTYGHLSDPASLDEVSKLAGLHPTAISKNAGFLVSCGIIDSGQKKLATVNGRALAHAIEHNVTSEISSHWRSLLLNVDFINKLLTAIKIRNGMDLTTLEAHIAYSAGQPKKPQFMTGARTIIDILIASELVKENDGIIVANNNYSATDLSDSERQSNDSLQTSSESIEVYSRSFGRRSVAININIDCRHDDIDSLAGKIKQLIQDLSSDNL